jgi:transcription elongation factor Elf1
MSWCGRVTNRASLQQGRYEKLPSTTSRKHESCPECGGRLYVKCTKVRGAKKYRRFECGRCGKQVSYTYEFDGINPESKKADIDELLVRMEKWIAENQPVTSSEIKKQFRLVDGSFNNRIHALTYRCPLWESDSNPILYGIDRTLIGGIEAYITGHVSRMSSYGHTSSLDEL